MGVLLESGAHVNQENIHPGSALGYAVNNGHAEVADLLRAAGAGETLSRRAVRDRNRVVKRAQGNT